MKKILILMAALTLSSASAFAAAPKLLWYCQFPQNAAGGASGDLENVSIYKSADGYEADLEYNRPFDDEAAYPVTVKRIIDGDKVTFHGEAKGEEGKSGFFLGTLEVDGDNARGSFNARIPASADTYWNQSESFQDVRIDCNSKGN